MSQLTILKKQCCFFLSLLLSQAGVCQLVATTFQEASQSKKANFYYLHDGVEGFAKQEGEATTGLLVDIVKEFENYIETEKGIKVTSEFSYVKGGDFDLFMSQIKNGSGAVFGLSNISIKEERKKYYSFSPPYLENVSVLMSNSSAPPLSDLGEIASEFDGMTAYTLSNTTYHQRLIEIKNQYYPAMEIVGYATIPPIMEQLQTNSNAFAILDLNYYLEVLQKKLPIKRHPVGDKKDDKFGIIMPKDCDWNPLLSDFFRDFIGSSRYSEIIAKHLGSSALRLINSVKD